MAVALFGVAVNLVGLSLATALIYGISIVVGSLSAASHFASGAAFLQAGLVDCACDMGIIAGGKFMCLGCKLVDALKTQLKKPSFKSWPQAICTRCLGG